MVKHVESTGKPTVPLGPDGKPLGGWIADSIEGTERITEIMVNQGDGRKKALLALTTDPNHSLKACGVPAQPSLTVLE